MKWNGNEHVFIDVCKIKSLFTICSNGVRGETGPFLLFSDFSCLSKTAKMVPSLPTVIHQVYCVSTTNLLVIILTLTIPTDHWFILHFISYTWKQRTLQIPNTNLCQGLRHPLPLVNPLLLCASSEHDDRRYECSMEILLSLCLQTVYDCLQNIILHWDIDLL